jgi:hypothetical protein
MATMTDLQYQKQDSVEHNFYQENQTILQEIQLQANKISDDVAKMVLNVEKEYVLPLELLSENFCKSISIRTNTVTFKQMIGHITYEQKKLKLATDYLNEQVEQMSSTLDPDFGF